MNGREGPHETILIPLTARPVVDTTGQDAVRHAVLAAYAAAEEDAAATSR